MFLGLCAFNIGSLTHSASAQSASNSWDEYTPLAPLPGTTNEEGKTDIQTYIPGIFKLVIGIAGVLAVLMIIIGGVEYITTDAIQGKSEGKARIQNALWGLVLVLVSWILLYTINPKLTVFNLNVETTTSEQTSGSGNYDSGDTGDNTTEGDSSSDDNPLDLPSTYDPLKDKSGGDNPFDLPSDFDPFEKHIESTTNE
ncbi:MAG: hypothetical protein UT90_C0016G0004 [Parcubacteria group bacterium GW2011_GWA1_40_21]|nr:MAG: hypothetical protein UT80_C0004G0043 [Parcubacteria group bacterium GW2011_GWC1_40_13]KKR52982.1 MAG: hypothetical protein UT90_C0016G0004 [Parcubacteria group bacterium GW2011_GWA1_40_21]